MGLIGAKGSALDAVTYRETRGSIEHRTYRMAPQLA